MTKILIVDDQEDARIIVRLMLRKHVTVLWEAANAATALQMVKEHRPDVVLFDIVMPGTINGFHACEMVKSDPELADVFVILMSGLNDTKDFEEARRSGANAYFVKPFNLRKLVEVVTNYKEFAGSFLLENSR
jgi:CheY-like chemotaxis protein